MDFMTGTSLAYPHDPLEPALQLVAVAVLVLVEDDEVHGEPLPAPVLMRAQQLPHDLAVPDLVDPDQHDREVPRYPVPPQGTSASGPAGEHRRCGSEGGIDVENSAGEPLEEMGFVRRDTEVLEQHLTLGPGQTRLALEDRGIVVLVGERNRL